MNHHVYSDIKEYEKRATGKGEYYTTGCLLNYEYVRYHYRLIAVNFSKQKELDTDHKTIQKIEFFQELEKLNTNGNVTDIGGNQNTFVLTI